MKNILLGLAIGIALLAASREAKATISLTLQPSSQIIGAGDAVSMDLVISGLGDHASPSLGAFDFLLYYDAAILSATSVAFSSHLDLGVFGAVQSSDLSTPGRIQLDQVSFESAADLVANQPSSFTLATLAFSAVAIGNTPVASAAGSLSDETGEVSLPFGAMTAGWVEVRSRTVPEGSSSAWLLGLAMAALCSFTHWSKHPLSASDQG